jgi:hypothetical protein
VEELAHLAPYGITAEILAALKSKADAFTAALADREAGVAERVGATASLAALFGEMDELLGDEVDRLVQSTRESSNDFYREYFASRAVRELGVRRERTGAAKPVQPGATSPIVIPPAPPPAPQPGA